jgi:hypothetical protein
MATFSTTTGDINFDNVFFDAAVNNDIFQPTNTATLTVNSDTRWAQTGVAWKYSPSTTNGGGKLLVDGRDTWWIPFDASSGNVPTLTTLGSNGVTGGTSGATGELLGIWTALGVAPSAGGGAMPTSGFVKLRYKSGTFVDNEVITLPGGATVTVNSTTGGQRGWLVVHWVETSNYMTGNPLSYFDVQGDWFELGTTNGSTGQTFQYYVSDRCPVIYVETGAGTGVYEMWLEVGTTRATQTNRFGGTNKDGRYFFISNTSGVITIGGLGGGTEGFLPPSGCKVRVANIHFGGVSTSNYNLLTLNSSPNSRFVISNGAYNLDLNKANFNGQFYLSGAANVNMNYIGTWDDFRYNNNIGNPGYFNFLGVSNSNTYTASTMNNFRNNSLGYTVENSKFLLYLAAATRETFGQNNSLNITLRNCTFYSFGTGTTTDLTCNTDQNFILSNQGVSNLLVEGCIFWGGVVNLTTCTDVTFKDCVYYDHIENTPPETFTTRYFLRIFSATSGITIQNITMPERNNHPRGGIFNTANCSNILIKDCGTRANPLQNFSPTPTEPMLYIGRTDNCVGITMKRCHVRNSQTILFVVSQSQTSIVDSSGDYGDSITQSGRDLELINVAVNSVGSQSSGVSSGTQYLGGTGNSPAILLGAAKNTTRSSNLTTSVTNPRWNGHNLYGIQVGDYVQVETPVFMRGYTGPANSAPTIVKDISTFVTYEYQIDTGSGFGSWKTANLSNWYAEVFPVDYSGVRIRARATVTSIPGTIGQAYIGSFSFPCLTNDTARAGADQPDPGIGLEFTGLISGSEVRVYTGTDPATAVEVDGTESSGTTASLSHSNAGETGYVQIFALGYLPVRFELTFQATSQSFLIQQTIDRQYSNPS